GAPPDHTLRHTFPTMRRLPARYTLSPYTTLFRSPRHQERDEDVREPGELPVPGDEIVLVTPVGVAGRVGVVLEEVDVARDSLLRSEEHTSELQSRENLVCRLLLEKKNQEEIGRVY